jgi:5-methylcytosine-specific restriction enzyme A
MSPDPAALAARVSAETGLEFRGKSGRDSDGTRWIELHPADYPPSQTFNIRTVLGWRRVDVQVQPGSFAGELLQSMGAADEGGRRAFVAVLKACKDDGGEIELAVNGLALALDDEQLWTAEWKSLTLLVRRGMLDLNQGDAEADERVVATWTSRVAAAVLALLPVEPVDDQESPEPETPEVAGLPEGAKIRVEMNRYERDRRNRAAALAIHGYSCKACGVDLSEQYGDAAAGFIEVHHTTPVSEVGPGYIINPVTDLVPLCPNCHGVAHRRSPPYTVDELREMLANKPN